MYAEWCLHQHHPPDSGTRVFWALPRSHWVLVRGVPPALASSFSWLPHPLHCPVWEAGCFHSSASRPGCSHLALKRVHLSPCYLRRRLGQRDGVWEAGNSELSAKERHSGLGVGHAVSTSVEAAFPSSTCASLESQRKKTSRALELCNHLLPSPGSATRGQRRGSLFVPVGALVSRARQGLQQRGGFWGS